MAILQKFFKKFFTIFGELLGEKKRGTFDQNNIIRHRKSHKIKINKSPYAKF
jgi:hypothetical protein